MDINIELRNMAFYYDTTSGVLYHFEAPNKDVAICKNLKQEDVLQEVQRFCDDRYNQLSKDADSIKAIMGYIINNLECSDILSDELQELQNRHTDLQIEMNSMNV